MRPFLPSLLAFALVSGASGVELQAQEAPDTKQSAFLNTARHGVAKDFSDFLAANPDFESVAHQGEALRDAIVARDETMAKAIIARAKTAEEAEKVVNSVDELGRNAIFVAVDTNQPALVSFLLEKGADLAAKSRASQFFQNRGSQSALQRAYSSDNPALLQLMLESGNANLKKALLSDEFNTYSLLLSALAAGNRGLVKAVLAQQIDLSSNRLAAGVLKAAAIGGDLENMKALHDAGLAFEPIPGDPLNETTAAALIYAAQFEQTALAQWLLQQGANVNALGGSEGYLRETALTRAIETGNTALIDLFLAQGADVNPKFDRAASPLSLALTNSDFVNAKKLLAKGAHLGGANWNIDTAPFEAALKNDDAALSALKADFGAENRDGESVLHFAALFGTPATLNLLMQNGAKATATKRGQTPLFWAVRAGNLPAVEFFLKNGASAVATDSSGQTPLHVAAFQGSKALAAMLLDAKADPNAAIPSGPYDALTYGRGVTALHRAAYYGNLPMMEALLAAHADINAQTENKETPLHFAAKTGQSTATMRLLSQGADLKIGPAVLSEAAREHGFSRAYEYATPRPFPIADKAGVVAALLKAGADPKFIDSQGQTALFLAVGQERGNSFSDSAFWGNDSSYSALRRLKAREKSGPERAKLVTALLKGGTAVNARVPVDNDDNPNGDNGSPGLFSPVTPTALHRATSNLDVAVVKVLLENGADATLTDATGRTALDLSLRRGENSLQRLDAPFAGEPLNQYRDDKTAPLLLDGSARREISALLRAKGGAKVGIGPFFSRHQFRRESVGQKRGRGPTGTGQIRRSRPKRSTRHAASRRIRALRCPACESGD